MKREDLINAVSDIDEEFISDACNARIAHTEQKKRKEFYYRFAALAAAAACIIGVIVLNKPQEQEPVTDVPVTQDPDQTKELEKITLSKNGSSSGMGIYTLLYPDSSAVLHNSPWTEDIKVTELPVYTRPAHDAGETWGLSEEEIIQQMENVMSSLNMQADDFTVTTAGENGPYDIPAEAVISVSAKTEQAQIYGDGYGTVTVFFNYDTSFDSQAYTGKTREEVIRECDDLYQKYGSLIKKDAYACNLEGDYDIFGNVLYRHNIYGITDDIAETLLNYAYNDLQFGIDEESGNLFLIRVHNELGPATQAGMYPVISLDEAYQQLYAGNYTDSPQIIPDESFEIADVSLTYINRHNYEYQIPYYRFVINLTGKTDMADMENLQSYGVYDVPAISPDYIIWEEDDTAADQPVISETEEPDASKTEEQAISETGEPFISQTAEPAIPDTTVSRKLDIRRIAQQKDWYCTAACVQMILDSFSIQESQDSLAAKMNTYAPGERADGITGTYDTDAARVLNDYLFSGQPVYDTDGGYRVQPLSGSWDQNAYELFCSRVIRNIDTGYPSIIQVNSGYIYGSGSSANHNCLITGYTIINDQISFVIVDPYSSTVSGKEYDSAYLFKAIINSYEPSYIW